MSDQTIRKYARAHKSRSSSSLSLSSFLPTFAKLVGHFWKHGRIGDTMIVTDECGSGHESAGEVFQVGEGVEQWKVGELEPSPFSKLHSSISNSS